MKLSIRIAESSDAEIIAKISYDLAYPNTTEIVKTRLSYLLNRPHENAIYVAVSDESDVVGWVHIYGVHLLESNGYAEIGGLVVLEKFRKLGIGRLLMSSCEKWAKERNYTNVRLRSGMQRKDEAHLFYMAIGYEASKQSMMFKKDI